MFVIFSLGKLELLFTKVKCEQMQQIYNCGADGRASQGFELWLGQEQTAVVSLGKTPKACVNGWQWFLMNLDLREKKFIFWFLTEIIQKACLF